ncbi:MULTISPECIES: tripartite tricarboxylate transporter TctB family protein [unclassified Aureimonas]|uniref:tripartite tricarboxylate transporter TctB family protein n=1 Tax=unclassified Aureimonas TaxID=2615206 RepID=UPI0006FE88E8|nr:MULTISPECIES: tripartite tricarboxylate transporter TctB family protein [unclassified Aureimonas]KQT61884.1 hypothetical protein ASG54_23435 [Aureimonas sp. Leaf460]KQT61906.1 hypothetical protein ASG62_23630 [Aureimonas sp. Leaf427]
MKNDLIGGLVLLVFAGGYFWSAETIPNSMLDDAFGPRGLPVILAGLLAVLALAIVARALLGLRPVAAEAVANDEEEADHESRLPRALGFLAICAAYVVALPYLGYPVSIALMIAAVAFYEGADRNWKIPATAIFGGVLFWLLFNRFLGVPQPAGLLF